MSSGGDSDEFVANLVEQAKKTEEEENQGAIKDDGTINWECPCIQREVVGPCGIEFRAAFTAYVDMKKEGASKPSEEFMDAVKSLKTCSDKFPEYYIVSSKEDEEEEEDEHDFIDETDIPEFTGMEDTVDSSDNQSKRDTKSDSVDKS